VIYLVDRLPEDVFLEVAPPSPPTLALHESSDSLAQEALVPAPANAQEAVRNNIVRELVETERKYVQDLEVMQVCFDHFASILCFLRPSDTRNIRLHCRRATQLT